MGLFDIFKSKTVEARYKTLLGLFRHTHRTFTITRNEKCVLEFTFGTKKESKQYWSITQDFNAEKIGAYGYYWDPSKRVTISMHTTIDGHPVKVERTFEQSVNQTIMFNTVMQSSIEEIAKTMDNLYGEEVNRELQEEKKEELKQENPLPQHPQSSEEKIQELLLQKLKEKGITVDEDKLKGEYNKLNNELYDGSKDYEINTLTISQKVGLLGIVVSLCTYSELSCVDELLRTIFDFSNLLGLDSDCCNNVINHQSEGDKWGYIQEVRTIKKDGPFIQFIYTCNDIIDSLDYAASTKNKFNKILENIGFSSEDIEEISHGRYNYRFSNNEGTEDEAKKDKAKIVQTWSLLDFAREHGKMQVGRFTNNETQETWKSCIFTDSEGNRIFVAFSTKIGELTPQEIVERKNQLKVVLLSNGNYILY